MSRSYIIFFLSLSLLIIELIYVIQCLYNCKATEDLLCISMDVVCRVVLPFLPGPQGNQQYGCSIGWLFLDLLSHHLHHGSMDITSGPVETSFPVADIAALESDHTVGYLSVTLQVNF